MKSSTREIIISIIIILLMVAVAVFVIETNRTWYPEVDCHRIEEQINGKDYVPLPRQCTGEEQK